MRDTEDIDVAVTAGNFVLAVGDFRHFIIADRIGSTVELVENVVDSATGRPTGQRGVIHYWRTGSNVATVNAFRILNVATTA
ncbi:MAG: hypothetical protein GXP36_15160 [Actinobacteria bacterium]|nr:hypothetical protein [Actinomycetota bacterium]